MNVTNSIRISLVAICFSILTACSTLSSNDSDDVAVNASNIEVVKSRVLSIYNVHLMEDEGNTIISGKVRPSRVQRYISGHIDVTIQNSMGKTVEILSTEISHRSIHRHHLSHFPRFRVVLSESLPAGAKIRVKYHDNREAGPQSSACDTPHCTDVPSKAIH